MHPCRYKSIFLCLTPLVYIIPGYVYNLLLITINVVEFLVGVAFISLLAHQRVRQSAASIIVWDEV